MLDKLKEKANMALKMGSELYEQSNKVLKEKTNEVVNKYQEYQDRERENISPMVIYKIDQQIKKSYQKEFMKAELLPTKSMLFESKLGGFPYLPLNMEVPKDNDGNDMRLLVQINCEDLKGIENFPKFGLIQIFIKRDKNYGINNFKVIYHNNIDHKIKTEDIFKKTLINELEFFPIRRECNLYFSKGVESLNVNDIRYFNQFIELLKNENNYREFSHDEILNLIPKEIQNGEIKIGGYPYYNKSNRQINNEIILFQLVANHRYVELENCTSLIFTINKEDLLNLNFTNINYNIG